MHQLKVRRLCTARLSKKKLCHERAEGVHVKLRICGILSAEDSAYGPSPQDYAQAWGTVKGLDN